MSDENFSQILRDLSREYFNREISLEDYRSKRKQILDVLDREYNGAEIHGENNWVGQTDTQPDFRKENRQGLVNTIAFHRNPDAKK